MASQSPLVGAFVPAKIGVCENCGDKGVAIPSGRGIRSGRTTRSYLPMRLPRRNPLWSGHSFRLTIYQLQERAFNKSQSPLVGAFVPAIVGSEDDGQVRVSQSPLVGAFVPAPEKRGNCR